MDHDPLLKFLPSSAKRLFDVIGQSAVLALINTFGGLVLVIPKTLDETHRIARAIGLEAAVALSRYAAGERFVVPSGARFRLSVRDRAIVAERLGGMSVGALAMKYGLTMRRVFQILRREGVTPRMNRGGG